MVRNYGRVLFLRSQYRPPSHIIGSRAAVAAGQAEDSPGSKCRSPPRAFGDVVLIIHFSFLSEVQQYSIQSSSKLRHTGTSPPPSRSYPRGESSPRSRNERHNFASTRTLSPARSVRTPLGHPSGATVGIELGKFKRPQPPCPFQSRRARQQQQWACRRHPHKWW